MFVGGGQVFRNDRNSEKTSVTPAWRSTLLHYASYVPIPEEATEHQRELLYGVTVSATQQMRDISPNSGSYWSETSYNEPNWEKAFWGLDNYNRLKQIKEVYDPNGVFRVWNGIGGLREETNYD